MSLDFSLKRDCNHVVSGKQYDVDECPRCYGASWYWDLNTDPNGGLVLVRDEPKLLQDLQKTFATNLGDNKFHSIGHNMKSLVGRQLSDDFVKTYLSKEISTLINAMRISQKTQEEYQTVSDKEKVGMLLDVSASNAEQLTKYRITVRLRNANNGTTIVSVPVSL
jgi:hypothetical protein